MIPGLVQHPVVGFIMVRTERGAVALGARGVHVLGSDTVEGEDPLAPFGERAVEHLRRLDSFGNAPDIVVNSFYDTATHEVAAFEELIGCHGGLGGMQMQPFLVYPSALELNDEEIRGAEHMYRVLNGWRQAVQGCTEVARGDERNAPAPISKYSGEIRPVDTRDCEERILS